MLPERMPRGIYNLVESTLVFHNISLKRKQNAHQDMSNIIVLQMTNAQQKTVFHFPTEWKIKDRFLRHYIHN